MCQDLEQLANFLQIMFFAAEGRALLPAGSENCIGGQKRFPGSLLLVRATMIGGMAVAEWRQQSIGSSWASQGPRILL